MRLDATYSSVRFNYLDTSGQSKPVTTLEEEEYPHCYYKTVGETILEQDQTLNEPVQTTATLQALPTVAAKSLQEQHLTFQENQRGICFDTLFGPYLKGASKITVTDPYIRLFYQVRNFMEFLETVVKQKPLEEEVAVHLITTGDEFKSDQQTEHFDRMTKSCLTAGITFTWEFDESGTIHASHIVTDHGWKILLDRGLDIFQHYDIGDAFTFANRLQQFRACKAFEVTYVRNPEPSP